MERNIFEKQRDLNDRLNRYRDEYYNHNAPSVSDEVYDRLFDELKELEQETGIQMANSPTQTVGYPAVSRLEKTRHEIPRDRKSTRLNSSHTDISRMPSSA